MLAITLRKGLEMTARIFGYYNFEKKTYLGEKASTIYQTGGQFLLILDSL
jgi:hypothetical protein